MLFSNFSTFWIDKLLSRCLLVSFLEDIIRSCFMKSLQALAVCLTAVAAAQLQPVPLHQYDDTATYLTEHYSDHGNAYDQGRVPQAPPAWHPSDPVRVTATTKLRVHELPTSNTLKGPVTNLPWQKQNTLKKFGSETLDVSAGSCSHVRFMR